MARKSSIWFREQTGWYMTTHRGKQVKLSQDPKEAERAFHALLAQEEPPEETGGLRPTFRKLADLFLTEAERTVSAERVKVQKVYLQSFCDHVGRKRAAELKVHHVTEWIHRHAAAGHALKRGRAGVKKYPAWGPSTCTTARSVITACLNWAVGQGYITVNPLARLKRGSYARRERILTADEKRRIRGWLPAGVREFVYALEQTGARPFSELARVTAGMVDWQAASVTLKEHKNAKRGKKRVIYLTDGMKELLRGLSAEYPDGPLFRTRTGNAWNKGAVLKWVRRAEKALGIPRLSPYAWRHTYITECLAKGMSADIVAELVGNSPATIHRYYSHLDQKADALHAAARRAVG